MKKNLLLLLVIAVLTPWCVNAQNFPQLSENGTDYWYGLFSHRASMTLKNNGIGNVVISTKFDETVNELNWKFEKTGITDADGDPTFKIISKAGGELLYKQFTYVGEGKGSYTYEYDEIEKEDIWTEVGENKGDYDALDRFIVVAAGEGNAFSFKQFKEETDKFRFQISFSPAPISIGESERSEQHYINMTNHTADREICAYSADDDGNPFSVFTKADDIFNFLYPDGLPAQFSTEANPVWYQIRTCRTGNVYASAGPGEAIIQTSIITAEDDLEQLNQLFRFEGDPDGFKVICNTGGAFKYNESIDRIILSDAGDTFTFTSHNSDSYKDKWELTHAEKARGINETLGSACLYGTNDPGNALEFIILGANPYEGAPELSTATAPKWYYVKNLRANRVLASIGKDAGAVQRDLTTETGYESQMFRFEGTYDRFKIICQTGGALRSMGDIIIGEESLGDEFIFQQSSNMTYGEGKWGLKHLLSGNGLNMDNNKGKEDQVTLWSISDDGSVFEFLTYENVVSVPDLEISKAQFIITDGTLTVVGKAIANVTVYDITGRQYAATSQYTYTLPTAGYYIVSINYADGSKENTKIVIR